MKSYKKDESPVVAWLVGGAIAGIIFWFGGTIFSGNYFGDLIGIALVGAFLGFIGYLIRPKL